MRWRPLSELQNDLEVVAARGFCPDLSSIALKHTHLFQPPESISTADCAERYRTFRSPVGDGRIKYSIARTPYNREPMNWADDPRTNVIVMVKPSRSGGTAVAENILFKRIMFGPMTGVGWYLRSDGEASEYVERIINPMIQDSDAISAKLGRDTKYVKEFAGQTVEFLAATSSNFTNREPPLMVLDESDSWVGEMSSTPMVHLDGRQKQLGSQRLGLVLSHPDKGWASGVAAAWVNTSRGIYIMQCENCGDHAAAHATKFWPDVPEFKLDYEKRPDAPSDVRIQLAKETAGMRCPHCDTLLDDDQRHNMVDGGKWMERGQTLDHKVGILGQPAPMPERGAWVHGLMLKVMSVSELAKGLESAIIQWERSGKTKQLKEFMSKQLGEIFEGKAGLSGATAAALQKRAGEQRVLETGECPPDVRFITAAVDVGGSKFDVSFYGWDLDARSWWLDRVTLTQIADKHGVMRKLAPRERIEDWDILLNQVVYRRFPIIGKPDEAMPVAIVLIDIGDGNAVHKGREFADRCQQRGIGWKGRKGAIFSTVKLIRGHKTPTAPEIPLKPAEVHLDQNGKPFEPFIKEYALGVHKLKELAQERLATNDDAPGQCYFAEGIDQRYYDEFFNERLVEGKWERNGPNESLDLFGYAEAGRQMLQPDRKDLWAGTTLPIWATPVQLSAASGGQRVPQAPAAKPEQDQTSVLDRWANLNRNNGG